MKYFLLFSLLFLIFTKIYELVILKKVIKKTKIKKYYTSTFFEIYFIYKYGLNSGLFISIFNYFIILSVLFSYVFVLGNTIQKVIFIICSIIISHIQMKIANKNKKISKGLFHKHLFNSRKQLTQYDYIKRKKMVV